MLEGHRPKAGPGERQKHLEMGPGTAGRKGPGPRTRTGMGAREGLSLLREAASGSAEPGICRSDPNHRTNEPLPGPVHVPEQPTVSVSGAHRVTVLFVRNPGPA